MKKLFLSSLICGALFACKKEENNPTSPSTPVEEYLNTSTDASLSINGNTENTSITIEETASNYIIGVNSSSDNLKITTSGKEIGTYAVGSIYRSEVNIQVSNSDSCNLELLPGGTFEITSVSPDFEFNMNFSYVCGMDTITIGGNVTTSSSNETESPTSYAKVNGELITSLNYAGYFNINYGGDTISRAAFIFLSPNQETINKLKNEGLSGGIEGDYVILAFNRSSNQLNSITGVYDGNPKWPVSFDEDQNAGRTAHDFSLIHYKINSTLTNQTIALTHEYNTHIQNTPLTIDPLINNQYSLELNFQGGIYIDDDTIPTILDKNVEIHYKGIIEILN